jgi:hypothetical protein
VKLYEHPDFEQAILNATEHFREQGLRAAIIEKDYYVTEVLRIIGAVAGDKVIFKGGTSLSKGWGLIQRFSEDIDLFLDPLAFSPILGKNGIDRELRKLRDAVESCPALTYKKEESQTFGGSARSDRFAYAQRFGGAGEVPGRVLLEAGTASGREPTITIELRSLLAQFLAETKQSLDADDESSFPFRLLHFRRTFVEKLFAIHGKVERSILDGQPLGTQARHYYDLCQLADTSEVIQMLNSDEYAEIKTDYAKISQASFGKHYLPPVNLTFADSRALFPSEDLAKTISQAYEEECRVLCYGSYPTWADVQAKFLNLRHLL